MPTVLRIDGFDIMIYTHDHLPMHVHVFKAGEEIVISLQDIGVRSVRQMSGRDVRKAQQIVAKNRDFLITEWERIKPLS